MIKKLFINPKLFKQINDNSSDLITNVDKRSGRGLSFKESEVKIFAKKNKIHFLQPDN